MDHQGYDLAAYLQLISSEGGTCVVHAQQGTQQGRLVCKNGRVRHATCGPLQDRRAVYEMLSWRLPVVRFGFEDSEEQTLDMPVNELLLEAVETEKFVAQRGLSRPIAKPSAPPAAAAPSRPDPEVMPERRKSRSRSRPLRLVRPPRRHLSDVLDDFRRAVRDLVSTDVVDIDSGLSIAGWSSGDPLEHAHTAAAAAEILRAHEEAIELLELARGDDDILLSTHRLHLLIRRVGPRYCHVVTIHKAGNIGLARELMARVRDELEVATERAQGDREAKVGGRSRRP